MDKNVKVDEMKMSVAVVVGINQRMFLGPPRLASHFWPGCFV